ncbi:Cholesterol dehydrogenase/isomerase [Sterolibacterium denitrificans]|uniref:Cholesterol dehydrogenase/isomerase n=1 Tax=Sterolibacterium denitrificans TaxID=157592 RepID=A9XWD3_9PROT|nr:NAD(P)-dependent oxidoreductase [Sterolibacterium denitrificans]ABV59991.1 cholesterol dehydrogenase/isomerase [Sterolibacterium denitrificans]SMB21939.1 Cholesterol dehydrogenase/isomerase [Sterolibacterium denitrificans]
MKTVLVTGACGAIGRRVVAGLVERGCAVSTLDFDTSANRAAARDRDARVRSHFGDLDDAAPLRAAVAGVAHVIHLAELRPPDTDADQFAGYRANVCATRALLAACADRVTPPRFVFASSVAVFGGQQTDAARRADAPAILAAADSYGRQKAAAEALVRASGLDHLILRLALTPDLAPDAGRPHPWLFGFHPDMRVEFLHPADAALALVNALDAFGVLDSLDGQAVRGRTLLLGGGARNRYRYLDWLNMALEARGLRPLPRTAFGRADYLTDWVDTDESEALLRYQRHDYPDWLREQVGAVRPRWLDAGSAPLARRYLLAHSAHHAAASGQRPRLLELRRAWTLARRGLAAARLYLS